MVYSLVTIVSRPIIGRIIDQKGFFVPSVLGTLCVAVTLVTVSASHDIGMFCIAGVFAGLGLGTVQGAFQTMAVSSVPPQRKGVATSTFLIGLDGGLCLGSAIAGVLAVMVGYPVCLRLWRSFRLRRLFSLWFVIKNGMKSIGHSGEKRQA